VRGGLKCEAFQAAQVVLREECYEQEQGCDVRAGGKRPASTKNAASSTLGQARLDGHGEGVSSAGGQDEFAKSTHRIHHR